MINKNSFLIFFISIFFISCGRYEADSQDDFSNDVNSNPKQTKIDSVSLNYQSTENSFNTSIEETIEKEESGLKQSL